MFSQLFGNYLVDREVISPEDYREIMDKQLDARVKLGTIAVAEGLMTQEQAEELNKLQMQFDRRFILPVIFFLVPRMIKSLANTCRHP